MTDIFIDEFDSWVTQTFDRKKVARFLKGASKTPPQMHQKQKKVSLDGWQCDRLTETTGISKISTA